jgi:hypothetical protein
MSDTNTSDFNITLFETCELLNRSKKSISRYIRRGLLHPQEVKSLQGTLEYRFSKDDIEAFKILDAQPEETRPDRTHKTRETGHFGDKAGQQNNDNRAETTRPDRTEETDKTGHKPDQTGHDSEVISLLKETTGLLKEQLIKKDEQIKDLGGKIDQLIERDRETNYILKNLQDKVFMLGGGKIKPDETDQTGHPEHIINADEGSIADKQPANSIDEAIDEVIEPIYQTAQQTGQAIPDQTGQDEPDGTGDEVIAPEKKTGFWKRVFTNKS